MQKNPHPLGKLGAGSQPSPIGPWLRRRLRRGEWERVATRLRGRVRVCSWGENERRHVHDRRYSAVDERFVNQQTGCIQALPRHKAPRSAVPRVRDRFIVRRLEDQGTPNASSDPQLEAA